MFNQNTAVDWACCHPSEEPCRSQVRMVIALEAWSAYGKSIRSAVWSNPVVTSAGKPSTGLIIAIRWLESFKGHLAQPLDTDIGLLTDTRKQPTVRATPPLRI